MKKTMRITVLASAVAALVAGCGGADSDSNSNASLASAGKIAQSAATTVARAAQWASVKFGGGGYIPGLIYHPTSPNVLYARTDIGGAYRWDQATSSWIAITDGFSANEGGYHGAESIALDPNDDQRVYMTTGMYDSWDGHGRIYISSDRGDHWTHIDLPFSVGSNNQGRAIGERLMVDPNNPAILFYGSRTAGLWKSPDRGQTWQQVTGLSSTFMSKDQVAAAFWNSPVGVEQVIFDTSTKGSGTATQTIYTAVAPDYAAAAGLQYNMYKTTDGGTTWTGITVPADVQGYYVPHMVRAANGVMYVAFTHDMGPGAGGPASLYKFDGTTWTLLKHYSTEQWVNFGMGGLSVSGTGANTRIALGVTNSWGNWNGQPVVQLSDDDGKTWREIAATMPHNPDGGFSGWMDDVEIDPNDREHILHVSGGGVWETHNASSATPSWTFASNGIEEVASRQLVAAPPGANYTLIRTGLDVGTSVQTELTKSPTRSSGGFSSTVAADVAWTSPNYMVTLGSPDWNHPGRYAAYSTDSGVTWSPFAASHPDAKDNNGDGSSVAVTAPGNVVWAPAMSIPAWTADNGAHWTYTNLPALQQAWVSRGYQLVADRKNPNKVYAYNSGGAWWMQWSESSRFYVSNDGGHTFTEQTAFAAAGPALNQQGSTSIAVNPKQEGDVWVADGFHVWHSTNSGATWSKVSAFEPIWGSDYFQPVTMGATSIAIGKAPIGAKYSASVYVIGVVGGVWGAYRSDDGGATWTRFNDDMHQFGGMSNLTADQNVAGRLYLAGAGRGVLFSY